MFIQAVMVSIPQMATNGLQIAEGGEIEALNLI